MVSSLQNWTKKIKVYSIRMKIGPKPPGSLVLEWKLDQKTKVYSIRMKISLDQYQHHHQSTIVLKGWKYSIRTKNQSVPVLLDENMVKKMKV